MVVEQQEDKDDGHVGSAVGAGGLQAGKELM